jgi:phosphate transport system permease protein
MNRNLVDRFFSILLRLSGLFVLLIVLGIFAMLLNNGLAVFKTISLSDFFTSKDWSPSAFKEPQYGMLSLLVSSVLVTVLALVIAVPIGVGAAAYLSQFARKKVAAIIKPSIEMLASIPSVTIGFLGIVLAGPLLADIFNLSNGLNALNGAILLAIMALPTIISISEDAMHSVPKTYKEASLALGANKWETLLKVVIPASSSGIVASIMLGMGRVIGETMTVLMVTGNATAMPDSIFSPVQPMTATIAIEMGEVPYDTPHYYSLFTLGIILFIITFLINLWADRLTKRFKKS